MFSGINLAEMFSSHKKIAFEETAQTASFDSSFVNLTMRENIIAAEKIMLVLYDEKNAPQVELTFNGTGSYTSWFSKETILRSSLWDLSRLKENGKFNFQPKSDNFFFMIVDKESSVSSVQNGQARFFKTLCKPNQKSANEINQKRCGLVYSPNAYPVYMDGSRDASYLQIYTQSKVWVTVFMVQALADVDIYDFYKDGSVTANSDSVYKDAEIESKIQNANQIKFLVFDQNRVNVVSEIVFRGTDDFETWFSLENVLHSSPWNFPDMKQSTSTNGIYFALKPFWTLERYFYISLTKNMCQTGQVYLVVLGYSTIDCNWDLGGADNSWKPPYFLYSAKAEPQRFGDMDIAGKIEIQVLV